MPLTLTVPALNQVEDLTVETRPKYLKEWLDTLPLTNLPEVSGTLKDELGALNQQKVAMETRLKLLELYRDVILKLLPAMEEQFVAARLPLPDKNRQMAERARQLQIELANGYKIILLDYQNKRITFGTGKIPQMAAQRAISALSRILAICYQTYAPTPSGIWFEIHQIFRFGIEQGIVTESVADGDGESSIGLIYKQTLLLSLANPYHLNQGEVEQILGYLALFGDLAQLQTLVQSANPVGLFLVKTNSDSPPKSAPQNLNEVDNRNDILLNTLELAHALHHHLERLKAGESPKALRLPEAAKGPGYQKLLQHLLKHWSAAPKRVFNRTPNISSTEVCVGLPALHHFLGGRNAGSETGLSSIQTAKGPRFASDKWLVVNESAGGLSLRGSSVIVGHIRPGCVIGLKEAGGNEWRIGAVRWAKSEKADHLEIGTQLLAPKADPVRVMPSIAGPAETFQAALLLPETPLLKQPETLIAPRGTFSPQRELLLEFGGGATRTIRAVKLVEQAAGFERFEFSRS